MKPPPWVSQATTLDGATLQAAYSSTVRAHVEAAHARDRYWWQAWGMMWAVVGLAAAFCVKSVPTGGSDRAFFGVSVPKGRDPESGES